MSVVRRHRLILPAVLAAVLAVPLVVYANHSWGGYHWARQSNPFTLKMGDNVSSGWQSYFDTALSQWSTSTVLDLTAVAGGTKPRNCRPTSGQVEVCNAPYGNNGWLGLAQIWITGGTHITQGVVKLNDSYFGSGSPYNTPSWRALVTCQEVGHTFGLDHQDETFDNTNLGTCMDYTSNPDGPPSNTAPNKHDYDELVTIYSHTDSSTTVAQSIQMPSAMTDVEYESPNQWGKLVSGSRKRGVATYDLDFGNGNHIVTHVFWAN